MLSFICPSTFSVYSDFHLLFLFCLAPCGSFEHILEFSFINSQIQELEKKKWLHFFKGLVALTENLDYVLKIHVVAHKHLKL